MAGKLDIALGFGRLSVAGGRAIPPRSNGPQNIPVAKTAAALQNQRTMHSPVSADNEIDRHLQS